MISNPPPAQQLQHSTPMLTCPYAEPPPINGMEAAPTILVQHMIQGK